MSTRIDQAKGHVKVISGGATGKKGLADSGEAAVRAAERSAKAALLKKTLDDAFDSVSESIGTCLQGGHGGSDVK